MENFMDVLKLRRDQGVQRARSVSLRRDQGVLLETIMDVKVIGPYRRNCDPEDAENVDTKENVQTKDNVKNEDNVDIKVVVMIEDNVDTVKIKD